MRLGNLISPAKVGRCGDRELPVLSITKKDGIVLQSDKFKKSVASKDVSSYKVVPKGKLVQGIHIDEANFGIQNLVQAGIVSPAYKIWDVSSQVVLPEYLAAALRSEYCIAYYKKNLSGTVHRRGRMSNETFFALDVNVPPIDEQKHVMGVLGEILAQIKHYVSCADKLEELVKSRFVEMFGDPVDNPFEFETAGLTELGSCKNGMNFHSSDYGVELPCLGVADFKDRSRIDGVEGLGTVSLNERPNEDYLLNDGDIVFVRSNGNKELVGRCLAVYPHGHDAVFSGFCIRLRLSSDCIRVPYLVQALKQPTMRSQMFGRGANVQNLNQRILSNVRVPVPSIERQDEFLDFVSQVDKLKADTQLAIDKLQMLYDSLAQEYFAGE